MSEWKIREYRALISAPVCVESREEAMTLTESYVQQGSHVDAVLEQLLERDGERLVAIVDSDGATFTVGRQSWESCRWRALISVKVSAKTEQTALRKIGEYIISSVTHPGGSCVAGHIETLEVDRSEVLWEKEARFIEPEEVLA